MTIVHDSSGKVDRSSWVSQCHFSLSANWGVFTSATRALDTWLVCNTRTVPTTLTPALQGKIWSQTPEVQRKDNWTRTIWAEAKSLGLLSLTNKSSMHVVVHHLYYLLDTLNCLTKLFVFMPQKCKVQFKSAYLVSTLTKCGKCFKNCKQNLTDSSNIHCKSQTMCEFSAAFLSSSCWT